MKQPLGSGSVARSKQKSQKTVDEGGSCETVIEEKESRQ